jgi:3-deoxy-7-phosphoheptulonate synthase
MLNCPSNPTTFLHPFPPVDERQHSALIPNLPAINLDAEDPAFAAQLRSLGAVQPNPHFSPTSTSPLDPQRNTSTTGPSNPSPPYPSSTSPFPPSAFPDPRTNPALMVLQARQTLQEEAEEEFLNVGRKGFPGRRFVDVSTVRQALLLRQKGEKEEDVERKLGLRKGRLTVLGKGVVEGV